MKRGETNYGDLLLLTKVNQDMVAEEWIYLDLKSEDQNKSAKGFRILVDLNRFMLDL